MGNDTDGFDRRIEVFLDGDIEIHVLRAHAVVCQLDIFRENGINVRHVTLTSLATRVHEHVANDTIRSFSVFLNFRDGLVEIFEDNENIFYSRRFKPIAVFHQEFAKIDQKSQ